MEKDDLHRQLTSLKEDFFNLGTHLGSVSEYLLDSGAPPPKDLIEAMVTARSDFDMFRIRALSEAQSLELQSIPELDDISSLKALESLLRSVANAEEAKKEAEQIREHALTILDRAFTIDHCDNGNFAPLVEIQKKARELRDAVSDSRWTDLHPDTQVLADGDHPFSALLTLVELQQELDDDQWTRLQESVAQSFGKPMSVAAARGKLFLAEMAAAEGFSASGGINDDKTSLVEHASLSLLSPGIDHDQTVIQDNGGASTITPEDIVQESPVLSQDSEVTPSPAEELVENQDQTLVEVGRHTELPIESGDIMTRAQHIPEGEIQDDIHTMEQADTDHSLHGQLRSVRREMEERQGQKFFKGIRQRFK